MPTAKEVQARMELADAAASLAGAKPVTDPFVRLLGRMVAAELITGDDAVRMLDAAERLIEIDREE